MVAVGGILALTIDGPQGCLMMMVIKCVFFLCWVSIPLFCYGRSLLTRPCQDSWSAVPPNSFQEVYLCCCPSTRSLKSKDSHRGLHKKALCFLTSLRNGSLDLSSFVLVWGRNRTPSSVTSDTCVGLVRATFLKQYTCHHDRSRAPQNI